MKIIEWFKNWATKSNRSNPIPRHPDLHPIDIGKISEELRLRQEAARLGTGGIPSSDAQSLTGVESAIVQKVENFRQGYLDWAMSRMNVLSFDLGKLNITSEVNRALNANKEFERKAASLLSENESTLQSLSSSAIKAKEELDRFRKLHNLEREANYPTGARLYMWFSISLMLILLEGVLNAQFFAQGIDTGLLGGLTLGSTAACINVVLAFVFGKFAIKYVHYNNVNFKILGAFFSILALAFILIAGLGIAHFRDALIAEASEPALAAFISMRENIFHLHDIISWALLIVSIFFGLLSMFDGYKTDDPYPGYGEISRKAQLAIDDYESEIENLRAKLEELKNEETSNLDNTLKSSEASVASYQSIISNKEAAALRLATALHNADHSLMALLNEFRSENELHRNGLARPKYFDEKPKLKNLPFPDFSTDSDKENLSVQSEAVEKLRSEMEFIRARIQEAFNHQYDLFKPLTMHYQPVEVK